MDGSRMIQVQKRDGVLEYFDRSRLAGSLLAAMSTDGGDRAEAGDLAMAIECYVGRVGLERLSSGAIFEMSIKILRRIQCRVGADRYEARGLCRRQFRKRFRIVQDSGQVELWDKSRVARQAKRQWLLGDRASRIIAGDLETRLMAYPHRWISAEALQSELNTLIAAFGLADAVPAFGASGAS